MSKKNQAVNGFLWNGIDAFAKYGLSFIISVVLARILSPGDYGLVGLTLIFIEVSQTFIDGGFSQSLLRKKDCTQEDYSTVFYFNLVLGVTLYSILYFSSGFIADLFGREEIRSMIKLQGIAIIISSLTLIQQVTLQRRMNFKTLTIISMVSTLIGGCVGIYFALNNYGALSIVYMTLSSQALASILYWTNNKWMPTGFYKESFKSLFKFGNKMLISRLINVVFENFAGVIITKFHSFSDFGLYTRADSLRKMPSRMLAGIVQTVSLPLLASLQDEPERLKDAYRRLIKTSMFLNLIVIFGLMVTAKSFILILLGEKWESVVLYLQLLCIPTLIFPMQSLNLNIISVKGRSDLHLKLELIKKITLLPIFAVGIYYGIIPMIWGLIANAAFSFYMNSYYSGSLISYPISEQIKDILPSVLLIALSSLAGYAIVFLNLNKFLEFFTQLGLVLGLIILISEKIKLTEYLEVKKIVLSKINRAA